MRELKFRAWQKVQDLHRKPGMYTVADLVFYGKPEHGGCEVFFWEDDMRSSVYLEDVELMQYTGLTDKKGREIYEGDIVKRRKDSRQKVSQNIGVVSFNERMGCFAISQREPLPGSAVLYAYKDHIVACEVIGNIWENPGLLKNLE